MTAVLSALLFSGVLLDGPPAARIHWHDDDGRVKRQAARLAHDDRDRGAVDCYITPGDARVLNEYYGHTHRHIPVERQRKLQRTAHIPPGSEERLEPLPVLVDRQLSPLPNGLRRDLLDGYVVIFDARTGVIVDAVALFALQFPDNWTRGAPEW